MKNLDKFINEARKENAGVTKIHFEDGASCLLFACELIGQITDGKYENSRPASHANWILKGDVACIVDGSTGYEGPAHKISYNLKEWPKYVTSNDPAYEWSNRVLAYGALGSVLENSVINALDLTDYNTKQGVAMLAREWQNQSASGINFKGIQFKDYQEKYLSGISSINNAATFKKFTKALASYDVKKLRADLSSMEESVNTTYTE